MPPGSGALSDPDREDDEGEVREEEALLEGQGGVIVEPAGDARHASETARAVS